MNHQRDEAQAVSGVEWSPNAELNSVWPQANPLPSLNFLFISRMKSGLCALDAPLGFFDSDHK